MPAYPFDPRPIRWMPPGQGLHIFRPIGHFIPFGDALTKNPATKRWVSQRTVTGRLIVGFNVGPVPTWSMDDLVPIVEEFLNATFGDPSSTFVAQRGIYRHADGSGLVVQEDGAQVFVICPSTVSDDDFETDMVRLAEIICVRLAQETVLVEIQVNGMSKVTMGVGAES